MNSYFQYRSESGGNPQTSAQHPGTEPGLHNGVGQAALQKRSQQMFLVSVAPVDFACNQVDMFTKHHSTDCEDLPFHLFLFTSPSLPFFPLPSSPPSPRQLLSPTFSLHSSLSPSSPTSPSPHPFSFPLFSLFSSLLLLCPSSLLLPVAGQKKKHDGTKKKTTSGQNKGRKKRKP